ncbi:ComEC/Rec2 family competence protein [Streptomyces sp. NPDC051677]|uniref:ComEC/Rec2 family competence protein n=1 Tax=Streptomyces sp. NPDC051677 TaxID=3365669 RepID=UPI0037CFF68C
MTPKTRTPIKDIPVYSTRRETRSATKDKRDADLRKIRREAEKRARDLKRRREQATASRKPGAPGERKDGSLHIAFIQMGQGDCIVLCTPEGRVILFDCGSLGTEKSDENLTDEQADQVLVDRALDTLKNPKFLGKVNEIDILILTHPDGDHCNKLKKVIPDGCKIYKCYHSAQFGEYTGGGASTFLRKKVRDPAILRVVKNHDPNHGVNGQVTLNGTPVKAATDKEKVDRLDGKGSKDGKGDQHGILIVDEKDCKVSILAAGVEKDYAKDHATDPNRASIVTLVEAFGEKLLLCGDATTSTEEFLLNTAKGRLKDLTVVQAAHHGSITTSSSPDFVEWVNPKVVVASAGMEIKKHHHPSHEVIQGYVDKLEKEKRTDRLKDEHETFVWELNKGGNRSRGSVWSRRKVYTTGSYGAVTLDYPES